jgi:hypothetical protein
MVFVQKILEMETDMFGHNPEELNLYPHHCENLISHKCLVVCLNFSSHSFTLLFHHELLTEYS